MNGRKYLWAVSGAVVFALGSRFYGETSNCVIGTPHQQSLDVASYERAMLEALRWTYSQSPLENTTLAQAAGGASLAWFHLGQCAAERGLEYCQTIGTTKDFPMIRVLSSTYKGSEAPEEVAKYRYLVTDTVPGPLFEMTYWTLENSPEVTIRMKFPEPLGYKFSISMFWRSCAKDIRISDLRHAGIDSLGSGPIN